MENTVVAFKFRILTEIKSLAFIQDLLKVESKIHLFDELEIEPYVEFSNNFQANYWHIKYLLLKDKNIILTSEHENLYHEKELT